MKEGKVTTKTTEQDTVDCWFDYRGAQQYSGMSRGFLWQRISAGELRAYKVGRKVRIRRSDLDEFLRRRSATTSEQD